MTISTCSMPSRFSLCPCCRSSQIYEVFINKKAKRISTPHEFFFGGRSFIRDLCACKTCGFQFINHLPENYQSFYDERDVSLYCNLTELRKEYFRRVKRLLESKASLTLPPVASVLDLGCGAGDWLELWGPHCRLFGTEVSTALHPPLKAKGIEIITLRDHHAMQFEMISMFDFLEHVEDPSLLLEEVYERIAPEGCLVLGVPDMGKLAARFLGMRYYLYCPMHFSYFNRKALTRLVERIFGLPSRVAVFSSPPMKSDLQGIAKWLGIQMPRNLNFTIPVGYSASLVLVAHKGSGRGGPDAGSAENWRANS